MVNTKYIAGVIVLAAVAVAAYAWMRPDETRKVKRQFDILADAAGKEQGEALLGTAVKARKMAALFADKVVFNVPVTVLSGTYTPDEAASQATSARSMFAFMALKFRDLKIEFAGGNLAKVGLTARLTGRIRDGESVDETRELECSLKKVDGKWLFTELTVVEVLKK